MSESLRIGVDLRYLDIALLRGMGRYTLQQLHTTIATSPQHHYYIFTLINVPSLVKPFKHYANVTLCTHFTTVMMSDTIITPSVRDAIDAQLNYYLHRYHLDVFYIPYLFHFMQPIPKPPLITPTLITVYDIIPFLYMEHLDFLVPRIRAEYALGWAFIQQADHLISISQATKDDTITHFGYDESRITVVYPALDKVFGLLPRDVIDARLNALWERLKRPRPNRYIFTVTDHFYTKNLDTLMKAYAQLPATLRADCPLVVTFNIQENHYLQFMATAKLLGIDQQIIFTRRVSDDELVALYNDALFTVYPSRYEGFGYPIAEAMACGSPVITTTTSSMPEVAGDATLLVNPEDAEAFTDAMHTLYHDAPLRDQLRQKGFLQYPQFNLDNMAQQTLRAFDQFAPFKTDEPLPQFSLRQRLILLGLRVYARLRWWLRSLKWHLYFGLYYPLKKRLLRRNN